MCRTVFLPDAVSSSENPLVRDQSATTGVVEGATALVLQRHLRTTAHKRFDVSRNTLDFQRHNEGLVVPARASCAHGHLLHQPPWSGWGGRWEDHSRRLKDNVREYYTLPQRPNTSSCITFLISLPPATSKAKIRNFIVTVCAFHTDS